jgi:molybdopterin-guanine dinucleotide biosynthesis protein A
MGIDKATLSHPSGTTYLHFAVNRMRSICEDVCVSTAPGPLVANLTNVHRVSDSIAHQGPILGVSKCLDFARDNGFAACLVTPVDMPELDADHLREVCDAWRRDPEQVVCVTSTSSRQIEPLVAIYPVRLADSIRDAAFSDDRSLNRWLQLHHPIMVPLPDQITRNVNTPADL